MDSNDQFITFDLSPSEPSLPKDFKPLIIHMFRAYHDTRLVADRTRVTALLLVENSAVSHISSPDRPQLQEMFCLVNETNVKALVHKMGIMYKFQYKGAIFGEFILRCEINTTQPVENFQVTLKILHLFYRIIISNLDIKTRSSYLASRVYSRRQFRPPNFLNAA